MNFNFFRRIMARAKNDAGERIESLRFSVPALRVGVLEYSAGQLQTNNTALDGKPVRLYYPPEAVSDEKFLKSLETAPVVVGGHDSTTNEQNKKIDGWAHSVNYDTTLNAAMINGVVKGMKEVAYVKSNIGTSGFGASAFVDIYNLKVENGTTPDGQAYDAIAGELRATHVALAPHVRDPENKIKVANAVCINTAGTLVENADASDRRGNTLKMGDTVKHDRFGTGKIVSIDTKTYSIPHISVVFEDGKFKGEKIYKPSAEFVKNTEDTNTNSEVENMDPKEIAAIVKNAVDEALQAKNSGDRMDAMEETIKKHGDALNEINEKLSPKEEAKAEGENAAGDGEETKKEEEAEKKEGATLENAKPSQAMVAAFATAFNVDFAAKTPSFATLGALAGIKEVDPAARIAAVNAKFTELQAATPKEKSAAANSSAVEVF